MILYALKDKNTEWYVTRNGQFDELCADTHLFKREVDAERCLRFSIDGFTLLSPMIRSLVRSLLEKKYKKPYQFIDVSHKEYLETRDEINLEIVKVQLNEKKKNKTSKRAS